MTLIRKINALVSKTKGPELFKKEKALVHFTSDNLGETLSIQAEGVQITMKYKYIEQMVERERSFKYGDGHFVIDETDRPEGDDA